MVHIPHQSLTGCVLFVSSLDDMAQYASSDRFLLFMERDGAVCALNEYSQLVDGDVVIIASSGDQAEKLLLQFMDHELINFGHQRCNAILFFGDATLIWRRWKSAYRILC